eukprot:TRINITY_DN90624_c0_g1_i1.p1 TRINITY_DN90624_c0_g1~~TRINITY_DN90624_c0_g1_i1.p1  ORF type:complete len:228 (-),score=27.13 TRINITY_DN90624_c0_g1_i1:199-831(-)
MAADSERYSVTAISMSGESVVIDDLAENDPYELFLRRLEGEAGLETADSEMRATVVVDDVPLCGIDSESKLGVLGILPDAEILFVMRRVAFEVQVGMQVNVTDAGTKDVNGTYIAFQNRSGTISFLLNGKSGPERRIAWYPAEQTDRVWPAGWYFEEGPVRSARGIYFQPSYSAKCLPLDGWTPYIAASFCRPGAAPSPNLEPIFGDESC